MNEYAVDGLRAWLLRPLVKPQTDLALSADEDQSWLTVQARAWSAPEKVADELLEAGAKPVHRKMEKDIDRLRKPNSKLTTTCPDRRPPVP